MVELHLSLKNLMVELHFGSKKVFPQKYHAFYVVKPLENTHFLIHLGTGLEQTMILIIGVVKMIVFYTHHVII
ncbi:Uncharacterized protein FWK35_00013876 [Aphis craccivora]|uniref:Uncharacterized protein n=1 Tax=Aphis craccivora TaxID=307492 RepID=A0A6G0ZMQ0_APHCR|nr:Uncharacterized protein FWK35_00013876 [Aphis craccivora]